MNQQSSLLTAETLFLTEYLETSSSAYITYTYRLIKIKIKLGAMES